MIPRFIIFLMILATLGNVFGQDTFKQQQSELMSQELYSKIEQASEADVLAAITEYVNFRFQHNWEALISILPGLKSINDDILKDLLPYIGVNWILSDQEKYYGLAVPDGLGGTIISLNPFIFSNPLLAQFVIEHEIIHAVQVLCFTALECKKVSTVVHNVPPLSGFSPLSIGNLYPQMISVESKARRHDIVEMEADFLGMILHPRRTEFLAWVHQNNFGCSNSNMSCCIFKKWHQLLSTSGKSSIADLANIIQQHLNDIIIIRTQGYVPLMGPTTQITQPFADQRAQRLIDTIKFRLQETLYEKYRYALNPIPDHTVFIKNYKLNPNASIGPNIAIDAQTKTCTISYHSDPYDVLSLIDVSISFLLSHYETTLELPKIRNSKPDDMRPGIHTADYDAVCALQQTHIARLGTNPSNDMQEQRVHRTTLPMSELIH
ncbi:hypothetical protein KJZ61_00425 [Candidatus Dependentiae bacterium]|nr:hypothetical protein [Candidatus Dependentiae bacterium]